MKKLSEQARNNLLVELSRTTYYQAILEQFEERQVQLMYAMRSVDPVKDPSSISKYQGEIAGLELFTIIVAKLAENAEKAKKDE